MEEKPMTVDELINRLNELKDSAASYDIDLGQFNIKIGDSYLFKDEIDLSVIEKEIKINGSIFHEDWYKKYCKFADDVQAATSELLKGRK